MIAPLAFLLVPPLLHRLNQPAPMVRAFSAGPGGTLGEETAPLDRDQAKTGLALGAAALGVGVVALMVGVFLLGRRKSGGGSVVTPYAPIRALGAGPVLVTPYSSVRALPPRSRRLVRRGSGGRFERV